MSMIEGESHSTTELDPMRQPLPVEQRGRDFFRVTALTAISIAIGVFLIATTVLISKDGVFYISQARKVGYDVLGVAQRYPPAYPLLLLAAHKAMHPLLGSDSTAAWALSSQAVTLLCKTLALLALFFAGKRLVGARRSFLAVLILNFLPYSAQDGSDVLREWPLLLVLSAGLWLLLWAISEQKWWPFWLVGLLAGLGYSLHPTCAQLALYSVLSALFLPLKTGRRLRSAGLGLSSAAGFLLGAAPFMLATGQSMPQQLQHETANQPVAILSVGGKPASHDPIRVVARVGEELKLAVEVLDESTDEIRFSGVLIPIGSRPVYSFRSRGGWASFWTMSESEKDLLLMDPPGEAWAYDGIACYAYANAHDASDLRPIYRLWSPGRGRHFYTIDRSQRNAMLVNSPDGQWRNDGIVFYVPAEDRRPAEAVPVHRFRSDTQEYLWSVEREPRQNPGGGVTYDGIAWYAFGGRPLPPGAAFSKGLFHWRPDAGQVGRYQLNLIVSNGQFDSCQLVQIDVQTPEAGGQKGTPPRAARSLSSDAVSPAGPAKPPSKSPDGVVMRSVRALQFIGAGVIENLMGLFALALVVGLIYRWRHGASPQERILMAAVLGVNVILMFSRYVWVEPSSLRRYGIPMVALTIFYVPVGLEFMAKWLMKRFGRYVPRVLSWGISERFCLFVLVAAGTAICLPKLVRPLGAGKEDYRLLSLWLHGNTPANAMIAVPDPRIAFYADRKALVYEDRPDPRKVDYIVAAAPNGGRDAFLTHWDRVYTQPNQQSSRKQLSVYRRPAAPAAPL
jgi:hypothetical protein